MRYWGRGVEKEKPPPCHLELQKCRVGKFQKISQHCTTEVQRMRSLRLCTLFPTLYGNLFVIAMLSYLFFHKRLVVKERHN